MKKQKLTVKVNINTDEFEAALEEFKVAIENAYEAKEKLNNTPIEVELEGIPQKVKGQKGWLKRIIKRALRLE